jgi:DNA-binding GntR family transcriptional regulator
LKPGSKIRQDELAERLGVSKLPVREALIALEAEGLVQNFARRGAFVAPLTPDDVREQFAIYGTLSGLAAERAAQQMTETDFAALDALLTEMASATPAIDRWQKLNNEFHRRINDAGASHRLSVMLGHAGLAIPVDIHGRNDMPAWTNTDHAEILGYLRAGDSAAVSHAMRVHLDRGADEAIAGLTAAGFWN